jgi:hypothetical protein
MDLPPQIGITWWSCCLVCLTYSLEYVECVNLATYSLEYTLQST